MTRALTIKRGALYCPNCGKVKPDELRYQERIWTTRTVRAFDAKARQLHVESSCEAMWDSVEGEPVLFHEPCGADLELPSVEIEWEL